METKTTAPLLPSNYVTLRKLQELRLKKKQEEEEERLRREKEEEEEKERLRNLEEEERERRRKEEEEEKEQAKLTVRSKKPSRWNRRRNGSGWPIAVCPPNPEADRNPPIEDGTNLGGDGEGKAGAAPGNGDRINRGKSKKQQNRKKKWEAKAAEDETPGAVTGSEEIALAASQSSPEKAAGEKGAGRGASPQAVEYRPVRVLGGGPERTVEIERGIGDLKVNSGDERRKRTAGARGGRNPGRGGNPKAPRGGAGVGGGMVWIRKTTST